MRKPIDITAPFAFVAALALLVISASLGWAAALELWPAVVVALGAALMVFAVVSAVPVSVTVTRPSNVRDVGWRAYIASIRVRIEVGEEERTKGN